MAANDADFWRIPSAWYPMRVPSRAGSWNHSRFQNRSLRLATCALAPPKCRMSTTSRSRSCFDWDGRCGDARTVCSQSSSIFAKDADRCRIPSTPHTPYCRASSSFACELYLSLSSPAPMFAEKVMTRERALLPEVLAPRARGRRVRRPTSVAVRVTAPVATQGAAIAALSEPETRPGREPECEAKPREFKAELASSERGGPDPTA